MDLEGIKLSETSDRERQIPYDLTYMWNLNTAKHEAAHRYREETGDCQRWGWRAGKMSEGSKKVQISSYKKNKKKKKSSQVGTHSFE